jgi:hypothetical protein
MTLARLSGRLPTDAESSRAGGVVGIALIMDDRPVKHGFLVHHQTVFFLGMRLDSFVLPPDLGTFVDLGFF